MDKNIFKYIVDNADTPVVVIDLDYTIIYMNKSAAASYSRGKDMIGKNIELFMSEETRSKIIMTVEWFKEDKKNNSIFAYHDKKSNCDIYMIAIRDNDGELVGACSHVDSRTPDKAEPFDID